MSRPVDRPLGEELRLGPPTREEPTPAKSREGAGSRSFPGKPGDDQGPGPQRRLQPGRP